MTIEEFENKVNIKVTSGIMPIKLKEQVTSGRYCFAYYDYEIHEFRIIHFEFIYFGSGTNLESNYMKQNFEEDKSRNFLSFNDLRFQKFLDEYYARYEDTYFHKI